MKSYVDAFALRDIDLASERFSSIYGRMATVGAAGDPAAFSMSLTAVDLGRLTLAQGRLRAAFAKRSNEDHVDIVIPTAGTAAKVRCGSRSCEIGVGDPAAVARPFETLVVSVEDGAVMSLSAPVADVIERAERLTLGASRVSAASQMVDRIDLRTPSGRALERTMTAALAEIVALDQSGLASVAVAGYEDLLVCHAALALFPAVAASLGRTRAAAPSALHRARNYIRENAGEPVEISRLVGELGIPVRTLQDQFRRCFGQSLRDWLMECRLENAHRALALPDDPTSVSSVAQASGFGNLGDFSVRYRKKYGVPPSETLRAARRSVA